jgi:hypothetical protein
MDSVVWIKDGVRGGKSIQTGPGGHPAHGLHNHIAMQSLQTVMLLKLHNEMNKTMLL